MNILFFSISAFAFMCTFFWAIDSIVHQKKVKAVACVISSLIFIVFVFITVLLITS